MADIITLGDVSTKDTGSGSQLKTGGRRKHNMADKCKKGEVYNTKIKKCISKRESELRNKLGARYDKMSQQQRDLYPTKIDSFKESLIGPTKAEIKRNKLLKKSIEHDYPKLKKKRKKSKSKKK